jgi:transposase InsO family protein
MQLALLVRLRTGWGVQRIAQELAARGIVRVSHDGVWRMLKAHALEVGPVGKERSHRVRYEREEPNALWHVDAKGPIYLKGEGRVYLVGLLDDHSRFVLAASLMRGKHPQANADLLAEAIARYGKPRELMTDNGTEFVNRPHQPLSPLQQLCRKHGIRHCPTGVATPETNGKIEAFWKTVQRELLDRWFFTSFEQAQEALERMREEYNCHRLHSGIGWRPPASRYLGQRGYDSGFAGNLDLEDLTDYLEQLRASAHPFVTVSNLP